MQLNDQQLAASKFKSGIASVLAVPGSGKTLTMTNRIANLIQEYNIPPETILALTFTRNAAKAMRDKLKAIINGTSSKVTLSTIHAWAMWLLKEEGETFNLLHGKEQLRFIRAIMKKHRVTVRPAVVIHEINLAKNNLITPAIMKEQYPGDTMMQKVAEVYETYEMEKKKKFLMDFNDLLWEANHLLKNHSEIREKYQQIFQHVLVDEYQDTNPAQLELLKNIIGNNHGSSFYVTGDDWQSIFSFTGATVSNILNFKTMYPGSLQFILDMNYRSTPQILEACLNLIQHNVNKIDKALNTHNENGQQVMVIEAANEEDEAVRIVNEIIMLKNEYPYKDMAILYRANSQSMIIEETLAKHKIPYHIENGISFYVKTEVKALLDYLRLIQSPYSPEGDDALRYILNVPNRYIGKKFITQLESFADHQMPLYQALKKMPVDIAYLRNNIKSFIKLIDMLIKRKEDTEPADMLMMIRESLDYDNWVMEDDVPRPDNDLIANINQLQMTAAKYHDIPALLNYTDTFKDQSRKSDDGVTLTSIHKAKGLEFPLVFVIGFVDGVLPNSMGDIEEERRIAFVGISRAMKLLYLSYSTTHLGKAAKVSPFLEEIQGKKQWQLNENSG
jgi:DNA helicase-2/ATP-dependent DNA helicase PcrA